MGPAKVLDWIFIPVHLTLSFYHSFSQLNPDFVLTSVDQSTLKLVSHYELTISEQAHMQELDSSYNLQKYSNYGGGPNKGGTGIVRDEAFRNSVSLSHQGRTYSDYTNDLHRNNMLGKSPSDETRAKMSQSSGGVLIHYYSYESNIFGSFITKSVARLH